MSEPQQVVVAGASGFVGRHLVDRLRQEGHQVRCGTRDPQRAAAVRPGFDWISLDVDQDATLDAAFASATALVFLVHRMRDGGHDLADAEARSAERVVRAAERAGLRRIVYLGGPDPGQQGSAHLRARARTGEILRSSPQVSTIELRAGMIVGAGSESWLIVRDLAMRLPVMVLPAWLKSRSQPIWVGDVVAALSAAVSDPLTTSSAFDLPGPEIMSAEDMLMRVAASRGTLPMCVRVPVLTPSLSSHWIRLVTRADFTVARQLVDGLTHDLVAEGEGYWARMPGYRRTPFDHAVEKALRAEEALGGAQGAWERWAGRLSRRVPR
jgi:uncharacterized protein YbjT (DUF2867 family)